MPTHYNMPDGIQEAGTEVTQHETSSTIQAPPIHETASESKPQITDTEKGPINPTSTPATLGFSMKRFLAEKEKDSGVAFLKLSS
ncbi:hypothetical protein SAMD00023353_10700180 [Rosellinia necatrix]|uniref:Uncharacterized protein n=1 Tax=Rosellinia necatrix TaxID=77044 RepID=A0A1W2TWN5_ROSNE|nr:hypothetical protein SAMD00023353_10700180 [Rosellinia necatrix]